MSPLEYIVRFSVDPDGRPTFEKLAREATRFAQEKEPGTVCSQWYEDRGGQAFLLQERFESSRAMIEHLQGPGLGQIVDRLLEVSRITRFEVLGEPSHGAQRALEDFQATTLHAALGFERSSGQRP